MGRKVLVVDDEKLIVKGLRFSLEQDDMEVDCAYDGEEALEMAKKTEYDIVLLDVMLPKLDGFEVCQQLTFCQQLTDRGQFSVNGAVVDQNVGVLRGSIK